MCSWVRFGLVVKPVLNYILLGSQLILSLFVKDLRILCDSKLLFSDHCNSIVNKAYIRANILLWCFHSRDYILQMKLFNSFVRPILEYNSPVWCSHFIKHVCAIERVQKFSPRG